jgi:hypothetical protein
MKNIRFGLLTLILTLSTAFVKSGSLKNEFVPRQAESQFGMTKLNFTENKGQVIGYDELPHPEVKFVFQQGATKIFLLEQGIAYQFTIVHYPEGYQELVSKRNKREDFEKLEQLQKQIRTETYRMDMILIGSNNKSEISKEGKSLDYTNYCNQDALDVHHFNKITYHDIYPGIDWVIYSKNGEVKYDFVLEPGADPSLIKMQFKHQEDLSLNADGSFTLKNSLGNVTEKKPYSFQNEKTILTQFILEGNTISFALDHYDKSQKLIIDPSLLWATYYGGSGIDSGTSCITDASGNVYMVGTTGSSSSIASGGHQNTFVGNTEAFLIKFNSSGVRQWATYYGGSSADYGYSCTIDASGNVYMSGSTSSSFNIASSGHQNTYGGGTWDAFLAKFNTNGILQWATYYGGSGWDSGFSCHTDVFGNVYLAGYTTSSASISFNGHQNTFGGNSDAFLVKFNSSGVRQWATYYGGTNNDDSNSCTTDGLGFVYLTGSTLSNSNIASGGHQNTFGGAYDVYLVKFDGSGIRQWATYYGGSGNDVGFSCSMDTTGNVFIAGQTNSSLSIASGGYQNSLGGNDDVYLVKFNSSGVRQWATYYGGYDYEMAPSCVTDVTGNVYFAGITSSTINIASGGFQNSYGGGFRDAFLVKFNTNGLRQWATYYGGSNSEDGNGCTTDVLGNVYLVGTTGSSLAIASGGHQNNYGGGISDAFFVKFCSAPSQPSSILGNSIVCQYSSQNYSVITDGLATSYSWAVPSSWGGTSNTNSVIIVPNASGILSVTASNSCGISPTQTISIIINPQPTITVNSGQICIGQNFTISANGANTYTYSSGSNLVSPTTNTTYAVWGTSTAGCVSSSTPAISSVTVNPLPIISVNSGSICSGQSFTMIANGANTYTYSSGSNVVSPTTSTSYAVSGTSSSGCISSSVAISNVSLVSSPIISVNSGSLCSGQSFTLLATGANTYTYSGGSNVVSPTTNTSYLVFGTNIAGCVSPSPAISTITVEVLPIISVNSGSICSGQSFTISANGANSYTFAGGTNVVSPTTNTTYVVLGTSTSSTGCVFTASALSSVTVEALPIISVNSGSICSGQSFTILANGANTYTYASGSNVVSPITNTSYAVSGTSAVGCLSQLPAISSVNVFQLPTVNISASSTVICIGDEMLLIASGAVTYTWNGGESDSSLNVSPILPTNYSVKATDQNGCENIASFALLVDECTGINELRHEEGLIIFPNPSKGFFTIQRKEEVKAEVIIYNSIGEKIKTEIITEQTLKIDLSEFSNGIYLLELKENGKNIKMKLIKQ